MTTTLENTWQSTTDASALLVRVLTRESGKTPLFMDGQGFPDDTLVGWSVVVTEDSVDTVVSDIAAERFTEDGIVSNVQRKHARVVESPKPYAELAPAFIDAYTYNSMFAILVDEFASKEQALEFAQSQTGKAPTPSGAEGEDPRSQWLN